MRLVLTALGHTWLDLRILESEGYESWDSSVVAVVERDLGPAPFGFRPTPDPWPPSWE